MPLHLPDAYNPPMARGPTPGDPPGPEWGHQRSKLSPPHQPPPHLTIQSRGCTRDWEAKFLPRPGDPKRPKPWPWGCPWEWRVVDIWGQESERVTEKEPCRGSRRRGGQGHLAAEGRGSGSRREGPGAVLPCAGRENKLVTGRSWLMVGPMRGRLPSPPWLFGMFAKHRERLMRPPGQGSPD